MFDKKEIEKQAQDYIECFQQMLFVPSEVVTAFIEGALTQSKIDDTVKELSEGTTPNIMSLNDYQKKAMQTATLTVENEAYMLLGLTAEVGELMDKYAKGVRNQSMKIYKDRIIPGSEVDTESIKKEVGDCLWFIAGICYINNWNLEDIAKLNLDKLADRKKRGVIVGNGDNR